MATFNQFGQETVEKPSISLIHKNYYYKKRNRKIYGLVPALPKMQNA
jgi:hypothetical protein